MHCNSFGSKVGAVIFGLLSLSIFGEVFLWVATNAPLSGTVPVGSLVWYAFSFGSGLLAALLPFGIAFVLLIAPSIKRDGLLSGSSAIIALSGGLFFILTLYGAVAAILGQQAIQAMPGGMNDLNDWILIFSGIFMYVLALGEVGLIRMKISSYGSAAPKFIQRRGQTISFFLLGIFLGNIGIGSIYPAIPLLLVKAAASASVSFGIALLAIHAMGRILPIVLIALLFTYGFDGARWIAHHGTRMMKMNGWLMILASSVVVTLGVFSHQWFSSSALYTFLSSGSFTRVIPGPAAATSMSVFGFPIAFGSWLLVALILVPLWWYFVREHRRVYGTPAREMKKLSHEIDTLESSRRHLEIIAHIPDGVHGEHILRLEKEIDALETKRRILEDAMRYGAQGGLRESLAQRFEEENHRLRGVLYITISFVVVVLASILF